MSPIGMRYPGNGGGSAKQPSATRVSMVVLVAAIVAGCAGSATPTASGSPSMQTPTAPSAVTATANPAASPAPSGRPDPAVSSIAATAVSVRQPTWLAAEGSAMWAVSGSDVARIDVATNTVKNLGVGNGDALDGLAATPSAIWVADFDGSQVLRIDPATGTIVDRIKTGAAEDVLPLDGTIWVTDHHEGSVTRIDARSDKVLGTVVVGKAGSNGPQKLAYGAGSVWVGEYNTNEVIRLNPRTGAVVARIAMPPATAPCGAIAATDTAVWVSGCFETPTVVRIDPATNKVVATIHLKGYAVTVLVDDGAAWVPVGGDGYGLAGGDGYRRELERINPQTNRVDRELPLNGLPDAWGALIAGGDIWIANGVDSVLRVPLSSLAAQSAAE